MWIRPVIVIPTFNNEATIAQVVDECLGVAGEILVWVFDDGSHVPVENLLRSQFASVLAQGRLTILRGETNRGKGMALRNAIDKAIAAGFTHLLAIDGDGQHWPREIPRLIDEARRHPWSLVIGARVFEGPNVTGTTKFGRKFSNFWVKFQTDAAVTDSQSGMRVYPLFHLQTMDFVTRRYDFEIEVLIRLLWRGAGVREVPVGVHYPPPDKRVSHFHKIKDNARITILNIALIVISLFRHRLSPFEVSAALGLGVWVGWTPFFGFHTLIIAFLSFFLRLNAGILWLGTQVSIPPLAPLLALASIHVGSKLLGRETPLARSNFRWDDAKQFFEAWLGGSLALGLVAGGLVFSLTYALLKHQRRKPAVSWSGHTRGGKFGNWLIAEIVRRLGLRVGYFCLYFVVPYFYIFAPKGTRASLQYGRLREPHAGFIRRRWNVLRHYYTFACVLLDRLYQSQHTKPVFQSRPHGFEHIVEGVRSGTGLLILGAHVGAWDIAACYMKDDGLESTFHPVQYEANGTTFNKIKQAEAGSRIEMIDTNATGQPILHVHQLISEGKPVGMMMDRPVSRHFALVTFLGKLTPVDVTAFRVAATTGVPAVFSYGFKGKNQKYDFFSSPARQFQFDRSRDRDVQLYEWAQEFASHLEARLAEYPWQWFNFFPVWSVPPAPPARVES